jgi:hypothetical protein
MNEKKKLIVIKNPFFGAGSPKQYNWVKDGYHIFGIGIAAMDLLSYQYLDIVVEGKLYTVSTKKIKDFIKKYRSFYTVKHANLLLGVFSKDLLGTSKGEYIPVTAH